MDINIKVTAKKHYKNNKKLHLDDIMSFGKYKGEQIENIIKKEPRYFEWIDTELSWISLADDLRRAYIAAIRDYELNK